MKTFLIKYHDDIVGPTEIKASDVSINDDVFEFANDDDDIVAFVSKNSVVAICAMNPESKGG